MENAIFPLEIFQLIIDTMACNLDPSYMDYPLRICSQVCRAFEPLCQRHIYHHVSIDYHNHTSTSRLALICKLGEKPRLCSYVKEVSYWLYSDRDQEDFYVDNEDASPSIYEDQHSTSLHEFFPNAHTLIFHWHKHEAVVSDEWAHPDPDNPDPSDPCCQNPIDCTALFNTIIHDFAGSQSIRTLKISDVDIDLQTILVFPSLQSLETSVQWTFSNDIQHVSNLLHFPSHLRTLDLSTPGSFPILILEYCPKIEVLNIQYPILGNLSLTDVSFIVPNGSTKVLSYEKLHTVTFNHIVALARLCDPAEAVLNAVAFPALCELTIYFHHGYYEHDETAALHKVMRHAPNLRSLALQNLDASSKFPAPHSPIITFYTCFQDCGSTLEHLSLNYWGADYLGRRRPRSVPMLCDALEYLKSDNKLKTLYLHVHILEGMVDEWMNKMQEVWGRLDTILTANSSSNNTTSFDGDFAHLQKITVRVDVQASWQYDSDIHLHKFRATLQSGWARLLPLLHVDFDASVSDVSGSWTHEFVLVRR